MVARHPATSDAIGNVQLNAKDCRADALAKLSPGAAGRRVAAPSSVIEMEEVFDAINAWAGAEASIERKSSFLTFLSSVAASTTRSAASCRRECVRAT